MLTIVSSQWAHYSGQSLNESGTKGLKMFQAFVGQERLAVTASARLGGKKKRISKRRQSSASRPQREWWCRVGKIFEGFRVLMSLGKRGKPAGRFADLQKETKQDLADFPLSFQEPRQQLGGGGGGGEEGDRVCDCVTLWLCDSVTVWQCDLSVCVTVCLSGGSVEGTDCGPGTAARGSYSSLSLSLSLPTPLSLSLSLFLFLLLSLSLSLFLFILHSLPPSLLLSLSLPLPLSSLSLSLICLSFPPSLLSVFIYQYLFLTILHSHYFYLSLSLSVVRSICLSLPPP